MIVPKSSKAMIEEIVIRTGCSKSSLARKSGISRRTIYNILHSEKEPGRIIKGKILCFYLKYKGHLLMKNGEEINYV
ncbi:MAG: hypothetical protein A3F67_07050 [Verrucomicrobia bacterium RIFCSPHIGHO2_12_FULL_41_10]|nr:MAG: hypothetical protein A3F67_07050 [Verrucomicrobia bacterium RIFCSPHIGHO2_12_FULL_41_10]